MMGKIHVSMYFGLDFKSVRNGIQPLEVTADPGDLFQVVVWVPLMIGNSNL
jgi:hypothetical protein